MNVWLKVQQTAFTSYAINSVMTSASSFSAEAIKYLVIDGVTNYLALWRAPLINTPIEIKNFTYSSIKNID